jgi:hypothetical protein
MLRKESKNNDTPTHDEKIAGTVGYSRIVARFNLCVA